MIGPGVLMPDVGGGGSSKKKKKSRGGKGGGSAGGKPVQEQRFSSYLVFGFKTNCCLGIFLSCYLLVMISVWPLLMASSYIPELELHDSDVEGGLRPISNNGGGGTAAAGNAGAKGLEGVGGNLHIPPAWKDAHVPGQEKISELASTMKKQLNKFRQGQGVTDTELLNQVNLEFEMLRKKKLEKRQQQHKAQQQLRMGNVNAEAGGGGDVLGAAGAAQQQQAPHGDDRRGAIVLGMHRSGTSMLTGLLVTSAGYTVGGPLIGAHFDNEKGFFERVDVVLQNDEFMNAQNIWWAANVINYDPDRALADKESKAITFKNGRPGLEFLNNPGNAPWLQKDPRMCITLKTWLKLMTNEPAIVFTYRHPLEVAMSLNKREKNFPVERGLRLWIIYNMRAIQNSQGLCMIKSSNDELLANPLTEVQRISDDLTQICGVPAPPRRVSQEDVDKFVDPNLQHNKKQRAAEEEDAEILATYNDGKCIVRDFASETEVGTPQKEREDKLYSISMKLYCDMQSGKTFEKDYVWPRLP